MDHTSFHRLRGDLKALAATVGTPGANGDGSALHAASARNRPWLTYGIAAGAPGNIR